MFHDVAKPLVIPFATALAIIDGMFQTLRPKFAAIFSALAPVVQPLTQAFTNMVVAFTPGLVKDAQTFAAVFTDPKLLANIGQLGTDLNAFFTTAAKHKQLIVDVFLGIIGTVDILLGTLNVLINMAAWIDTAFRTTWKAITVGGSAAGKAIIDAFAFVLPFVSGVLGIIINGTAAAFGWVPGIGPKLKAAAREFDTFAAQVNTALAGIKDKVVNVSVKVKTPGGGTALGPSVASTFAAAPSWTPFAPGMGRTEPPRQPTAVTATVNNVVNLDGQPFRAMTSKALATHSRRQRIGVR